MFYKNVIHDGMGGWVGASFFSFSNKKMWAEGVREQTEEQFVQHRLSITI